MCYDPLTLCLGAVLWSLLCYLFGDLSSVSLSRCLFYLCRLSLSLRLCSLFFLCLCESVSYVTTDGQSASLSWNKAPNWGLRSDFITVWQLWVYWCGALSLTRGRVCHLQLLLALASEVILESEPLGTHDHILLSQVRDFPFRRLLRLAGSRWGYSTPPPHGFVSVSYLLPLKYSVCFWNRRHLAFSVASVSQ
jgi:hypothetical protein